MNTIIKKRKDAKGAWNRYQGYNCEMFRLVEERFGTVEAFIQKLGVTRPTGYKYMKNPLCALDRNQIIFKKMCKLLKLEMCDAITRFTDNGEGEE